MVLACSDNRGSTARESHHEPRRVCYRIDQKNVANALIKVSKKEKRKIMKNKQV